MLERLAESSSAGRATMPSTFGPRVTRLGALLLAAVATFGVAMPRARVTARERVGRAVAIRLASPRINDRLGWVAPDPKEVTVGESLTGLRTPTPDAPSAAGRPEARVALAAPVAVPLQRLSGPGHQSAAVVHRHRTFARPPPHA